MSKQQTNCPNCGAPIDYRFERCTCCGTYHVDISAIPTDEPFYLRINVGTRRHPRIVCQKVMTYGASMEMDTGPLTLYANELPVLIRHSPEMEYNISFHGVGDVIVYEPEEGCNEKM